MKSRNIHPFQAREKMTMTYSRLLILLCLLIGSQSFQPPQACFGVQNVSNCSLRFNGGGRTKETRDRMANGGRQASLCKPGSHLTESAYHLGISQPFETSQELLPGSQDEMSQKGTRSVDVATRVPQLDLALFFVYACSVAAITVPVVLLPTMATELASSQVAGLASVTSGAGAAAAVAAMASKSTIGGALGKFFNGFVCQSLGGRAAARMYLLGLSLCSAFLSITSTLHGLSLAGMEFCSSAMWTACTVMFAEAYAHDGEKFAAGITLLSLASTVGALMAKTAGSAMLTFLHWRDLARVGAFLSLIGAAVVHRFVQKGLSHHETHLHQSGSFKSQETGGAKELKSDSLDLSIRGVLKSIRHVTGNKLFWQVGLAHAMAFVARSSDKILGSFFHEALDLPKYICGGLTSFVTIGFVHGLVTGRKVNEIENMKERRSFVTRRYGMAALSALGLAMCANADVLTYLGKLGKLPVAALAAVASAAMASSLSYQFYQIPPNFSKRFGNNKAVCVSFLDGMGFFLGAPIWATLGWIVGGDTFGGHSWSLAWALVGGLFTLGGAIMRRNLPVIMNWEDEKKPKPARSVSK